jgi:death-on-curing protein
MSGPAFLDIEDVLEIHLGQIEAHGGSTGVRDVGLLESALAMPRAGFGGEYLHTDVFEMASAYLFHIAKNHPFIDGNKRTATVASIAFLRLNGHELLLSDDEVVELAVGVAEGRIAKSGIAELFRGRSTPI